MYFSDILKESPDSTRGYQHVGLHLAQNLLSVCKYLTYPGKLLRLYSKNQLSFMRENEINTTPLGIQQESEPTFRRSCKTLQNVQVNSSPGSPGSPAGSPAGPPLGSPSLPAQPSIKNCNECMQLTLINNNIFQNVKKTIFSIR